MEKNPNYFNNDWAERKPLWLGDIYGHRELGALGIKHIGQTNTQFKS